MGEFERYLEFQREIAEATLETIRRYQGKQPLKRRRTYKTFLVEDILRMAGHPLHISDELSCQGVDTLGINNSSPCYKNVLGEPLRLTFNQSGAEGKS